MLNAESIHEYLPDLIVHAVEPDRLLATRGLEVLQRHGGEARWRPVIRLPGRRIPGPLGRLLRSGVRHLLPLDDGGFLAFSDGRIVAWDAASSACRDLGAVRRGRGPLRQSACQDPSGTVYFGEYWGNPSREAVCLWQWRREWPSPKPYYTFAAGRIRHIHAVQWDAAGSRLWVATGDRDHESVIGWFEDSVRGPVLQAVASGSQQARAVSLLFTPQAVFWGSDAGRDTEETTNWICRWERGSAHYEAIAPLGAPAYYSTVDAAGRLYISTAVEGSCSETDRLARVWVSETGERWEELAVWVKDSWPMLFGYGVLSFPHGPQPAGRLSVAGHGVEGGPATWVLPVGEPPVSNLMGASGHPASEEHAQNGARRGLFLARSVARRRALCASEEHAQNGARRALCAYQELTREL